MPYLHNRAARPSRWALAKPPTSSSTICDQLHTIHTNSPFPPLSNARLNRRPLSSSWKSEIASFPRHLAHGARGLGLQVVAGSIVWKKEVLSVAALSLAAVMSLRRGFGSKRADRGTNTLSDPGRCGRLPRGASADWKRRLGRQSTWSSHRGSLHTPMRRLYSERGAGGLLRTGVCGANSRTRRKRLDRVLSGRVQNELCLLALMLQIIRQRLWAKIMRNSCCTEYLQQLSCIIPLVRTALPRPNPQKVHTA